MSSSPPSSGSDAQPSTLVSVQWEIRAHGCARFTLSVADEVVVIGTTDLGDGLGSLLDAAAALLRGAITTWCCLPDEPTWTGLFFGGAAHDVYVQIVGFDNHVSTDNIWAGGRTHWTGRVPIHDFCAQVATAAETALASCGGEDGYPRVWGGSPFPTPKLRELRQLLGT